MSVAIALLLCVPTSAVAAKSAGAHYADAIDARAREDYRAAVIELRRAVALAPGELRYRLTLAETELWVREFMAAESSYRDALNQSPGSVEARVGLGTALLWQQEYTRAIQPFSEALRAAPRNADARVGLANALYWSGDTRGARVQFAALLEQHSDHVEARRAIDQIDSATRPGATMQLLHRHDDQPFEQRRGEVAAWAFSDPLTRWSAALGSYDLDAPDTRREERAPFAEVGVTTTIPKVRLTFAARARLISFHDETALYPALAVSSPVGGGTASLSWSESELLYTERSISTHPSMQTISARWLRERDTSWSASASANSHLYSDHNRGVSADAWMLIPLFHNDAWTVRSGPSLSYRDSDESRFRHDDATGRGIYDPYWTPERLLEARLVVSMTRKVGPGRISLHADGGRATDEVPDLFGGTDQREFWPWRASVAAEFPLTADFSVSSGVERASTVFYRSNELFVKVAARF